MTRRAIVEVFYPATPVVFIKPTQHKPPMKVNIFQALNLHAFEA
jgi:hypothetical protein